MPYPDLVRYFFDSQSGLFNERKEQVGAIQLAVPVGYGGKIQRSHHQTERRSSKTLSVPKWFEDKNTGVVVHRIDASGKDGNDFGFGKAAEKLA